MASILVADDNRQITSVLEQYLIKEGHSVIVAHDGEDAFAKFESLLPDALLLDVMMPKLDGFELCRKIRKTSGVPIIMITARGEDFERIMGLDIGADDYIVKPFSPGEVMARLRAILRRIDNAPVDNAREQILNYDNLVINLDRYTAAIGDVGILLTKKEIELAWTLVSNRGKVFSRDNLLDSIWGYDYFGDNRTVDSHIKRLRAKLDAAPHPNWQIKTIWGVGYKFEETENGEK